MAWTRVISGTDYGITIFPFCLAKKRASYPGDRLSKMLVGVGAHFLDDRQHISALPGERVADGELIERLFLSADETELFELPQASGKRDGTDLGDGALKLGEAFRAVSERIDDEKRPGVAEDSEGGCSGAGGKFCFGGLTHSRCIYYNSYTTI